MTRLLWLPLVAALTLAVGAAEWDTLKAAGDKALAARDYARAVEHFERLVAANPGRAEAYTALGYALYMQGEYQPAVTQFEKALDLNPKDSAAPRNLLLATGPLALERTDLTYAQRRKMLDDLESRFPNHPQLPVLRYYRGQLAMLAGDTGRGIEDWEKVARDRPESATARFIQGLRHHKQGRLGDAERLYKAAEERVQNDAVIAFYRALLLADQGRPEEALRLADKASDYPGLVLGRARFLHEAGRTDEAVRELEAASLDQAGALLALGSLELGRGNRARARSVYEKALKADDRPVIQIRGESGASLWVDDLPVGRPPAALFVEPGRHKLLVDDGGKLTTREVEARPGEMIIATAGRGIQVTSVPASPGLLVP